jgi:hypothetical protein
LSARYPDPPNGQNRSSHSRRYLRWQSCGYHNCQSRTRNFPSHSHNFPRRKNACRSLQAEVLKASLAVEQKVVPPCTRTTKEIRSMVQHFKAVPDFRPRFESYPLWSLLTIVALATLCGAPRGQKELAKFARGLSQAQRRALGIRRNPQGKYPAPTQPTFCRMLVAFFYFSFVPFYVDFFTGLSVQVDHLFTPVLRF